MRQGRFGGLLLAVLLAASILQDAVDARRSLNKCCPPDEHLYYSMTSGLYECETASYMAKRTKEGAVDEVASSESQPGDVVDDVGGVNSTTAAPGGAVDGIAAVNFTTSYEDVDDAGRVTSTTDLPEGVDADYKFGKFLAALRTLSNASLGEDDVVVGVTPSCTPDDTDWLFGPRVRLRTTPNDVMLQAWGRHEFAAHAWCVDLDDEDDVTAIVCPCAGAGKPCVRKCCLRNEAFHGEQVACVKSALKPWRPTPAPKDANMTYYLLADKIPRTCTQSIEKFHRGRLTLLPDGSLKGVDQAGRDAMYGPGRFCVDAAAGDDATNATDGDGDGEQLVLYCIELDELSDAVTIFKGVITMIGALALLITVVLTAIFPEMRQNIHGKMAICHNSSLLGAFICIGVSQLSGGTMSTTTCKVLSFVMQYTLLAAFFWLNVMCVEVSWVFSALRPVKKLMVGRMDSKFMWYSVYAWGTTSLISVITMLVEFVPGAKLKPRFGEANCFFHGDEKIPQLLFLFGPMAILLAINVCLFVFTATKIIAHRRQTSILKTNDSNINNRNKQNLILYLKLFTLMGVTWVFEIISWAVGGKNYYWLAIDCVNLLRGVFIFFIFCCKRSVLELVRARFGCAAAQEGSQNSGGTKSTGASNEGLEMNDAATSARRTSDPR